MSYVLSLFHPVKSGKESDFFGPGLGLPNGHGRNDGELFAVRLAAAESRIFVVLSHLIYPLEIAMSNEQIDAWATLAVAAMLARVRSVLIWEYEHLIDDLRAE
jgi:hypothetical protein